MSQTVYGEVEILFAPSTPFFNPVVSRDRGPAWSRSQIWRSWRAGKVDDVALAFENAVAALAKAEMPPSTVTSGNLHVDAAFIRGLNDERIELVRFR
jgi:hypothetical protein